MKVRPKQLGLPILRLGLQPLQQPFAATVFCRCGQPVDAGVESGAERQHRHRHSHADPAGNGPLQDWLHRHQTDEQAAEEVEADQLGHLSPDTGSCGPLNGRWPGRAVVVLTAHNFLTALSELVDVDGDVARD